MEFKYGLLVALVFAIIIALFGLPHWLTVQEFDGTLIRIVQEPGTAAVFAIEKDDGSAETFTNEDDLYMLKVNSRDLLTLKDGGRYHFKVNMFRVPLFSWSRNLLTATPVGQ